jgi:Chalcone isomerase-like
MHPHLHVRPRASWRLGLAGLTLALGLNAGLLQAASLEGQRFDDRIQLDGKPLVLNGLGLRGVAWLKAFVAGVYVTVPSRNPQDVLAQAGPKRLRLRIMVEASSHELTKSLVGRVRKHEPQELQRQLGTRITQLGQQIDSLGKLKPGDNVDLDWLPGRGTQLSLNGRPVGAPVAGDDLYAATLRIFVGERPVDRRMKAGMLAGGV